MHGAVASEPALTSRPRGMFYLYAALGLLAAFLYRRLPRDHSHAADAPKAALGPSKNIVYKLAALFSMDAFAGGFVVQSLLALWLFQRFDLSLSAAGLFFFWASTLSAFSYPVAAWISRRIGLVNTMVFTHIPSSISPAIAGVLLTTSFSGLPLVVCGALKIAYDLALLFSFRHIKPPEERG